MRLIHLFAEGAELRLLLLLLSAQVLDVLDTLLQHGGLAHLVTRGVRLLAVRHQLLQEKPVIDWSLQVYSLMITCSES